MSWNPEEAKKLHCYWRNTKMAKPVQGEITQLQNQKFAASGAGCDSPSIEKFYNINQDLDFNNKFKSTTSVVFPIILDVIPVKGPSRQVRVLPGLGKVHVSYSYDRYVPYVGHKRLTVVTPPRVFATRPAVLQKEFERIENKLRPWYAYSATNRYLNSDSAVRTYYHVSYPTSYYGFYDSINLPSSPFLPKTYRWYYSWPRQYSSYWPYYYPSFSYYWPSYRPYLSSYLRNLYFNDYWPYSTYWSTYWPYYRSLDYEFSDLEDKIRNLRMLTYLRNPITGYEYSFWPDAKFFYHYKIYRPLSFHVDWPITSREWYPGYWPSYRSYWHYLRDTPSEDAFRQLRVRNDLYWHDTRVA